MANTDSDQTLRDRVSETQKRQLEGRRVGLLRSSACNHSEGGDPSRDSPSAKATGKDSAPATPRPSGVADREDRDSFDYILEDVEAWIARRHRSGAITGPCKTDLLEFVGRLKRQITQTERALAMYMGGYVERQEIMKLIQDRQVPQALTPAQVAATGTYASAVSSSPKPGPSRQKTQHKKRKTVSLPTVYVNDPLRTSADIVAVLKATVKPSMMGVEIKKIKETPHGVVLSTGKATHVDVLIENSKLKKKGLVFTKPPVRKPRVIVYDVEPQSDTAATLHDIYRQNFKGAVPYEQYDGEINIIHMYKKAQPPDARSHWVVELRPT